MKELSWKWIAMAALGIVLLVGTLLVVALTEVTVGQAMALLTGAVGLLGGTFGPAKMKAPKGGDS